MPCLNSDAPAQRLYARLLTRAGPHFRCDSLDYTELLSTPVNLSKSTWQAARTTASAGPTASSSDRCRFVRTGRLPSLIRRQPDDQTSPRRYGLLDVLSRCGILHADLLGR
jgi:hypothetical protein